jgi:hypothetical protein
MMEIVNFVRRAGTIAATLLVVGCTQDLGRSPDNQPDIGITQAVLDAYTNRYLRTKAPEAFAVSENGRTYDFYYCDLCESINNLDAPAAVSEAISGCNQQGQGRCVLFAVRRAPPRKYHIIQ